MRRILIKQGKYEGEHWVYDSIEEFANATGLTYKVWGDHTIQADDWVLSDDGFIIQCLHTSVLKRKYNNETYLYRFPHTTRYTYTTKKGIRVPIFYVYIEFGQSKGQMGRWKKKDNLFGMMVEKGYTLEQAYQLAFKKKPTKLRLAGVIDRNKEVIMETIQKNLATINDRVKEATGLTIEEIVDEKISQVAIATHNQTNVKEIRENVKFLFWFAEQKKKGMKTTDENEVPPLMNPQSE